MSSVRRHWKSSAARSSRRLLPAAPFPGRSSSIPKRRDGSSTTATRTETESSIRFTWVVPVAPRTSSIVAPATRTAHVAVATNRRSSTRWVRPESTASTWRPSERTAGMAIRSTHNPFVNNDPAQGLNAAVLNQWEGWITALESQHVAVFFILYDDHADPFGGSTVGVAERAFIHGLIDRFENHTNIIWCVAEEYPTRWCRAAFRRSRQRSERRMTMPTRSRSIRRPATTRWTSRMTRTSTNLRSSRTPPRRPGSTRRY